MSGAAIAPPALRLSGDVDHEGIVRALFYGEVLGTPLRRVHLVRWPTPAPLAVPADADVVLRIDGIHCDYAVFRLRGCPVLVQRSEGEVELRVGYARPEDLAAILAGVRAGMPPAELHDEQTIPLAFWMASEHGPRGLWRDLRVPSWREVRENYSATTRSALDRLIGFAPADGGHLLLCSGAPGTGKTWAIRALAWEWRAWCRVHYITDPEVFLGNDVPYLMHVMLSGDDDLEGAFGDVAPNGGLQPSWRLLLLEDTGELLTADAKERVGQGLSRLLNVVDGLIGQGLRVLVMVTTNEEVAALHPAVSRPGRCVFLHEFDRLSVDEANAWLRARGSPSTVAAPVTIAELYGMLAGREAPKARVLGFEGTR